MFNQELAAKLDVNVILQEEDEEHEIRKGQARKEKEKDKQKAQSLNTFSVAKFDLQAVFCT